MSLFWVCMALLIALAIGFLGVPLWIFRKRKGVVLPVILLVMLPFVALGLYRYWGNYEAVKVSEVLTSHEPHSAKQLVKDLEVALKKQPENYRAWFLLGESWLAARQFDRAAHAFEKAVLITGDAPEPLSKYAQALFLANGRKMTPKIEDLANKVLLQVPDDRTALGLKGIAAFDQTHYHDAIKVWTKLLTLTEKPETRKMIESGIKKARQLTDLQKGN